MRSRSQTWRGEAEPHNWTVSRRRPVRLRPRERAKRSSSSRPPRWQRRRHAFFTFLATTTLLHTERTRSLQCYVLDLRGPAYSTSGDDGARQTPASASHRHRASPIPFLVLSSAAAVPAKREPACCVAHSLAARGPSKTNPNAPTSLARAVDEGES